MIPYVGCERAQEILEAFVDGELPVADQVAVESHLRWCRTCRARVEDLTLIGASLRLGSPAQREIDVDEHALAAMQASTLMRIRAEEEQSYRTLLREMFVDLRFFWPALGATTAVVLGALLVGGVLSRAAHDGLGALVASTRPAPHVAALARGLMVIEPSADPGSDRNPIRLNDAERMPRALDGGMLLERIPDDEAMFMVATVVSRRGRIETYELLRSAPAALSHPSSVDHTPHVDAVLDAVRQSRFTPAMASSGQVVAVNMVWLIAKTTAVMGVPQPPHEIRVAPEIRPSVAEPDTDDEPSEGRSSLQGDSTTA